MRPGNLVRIWRDICMRNIDCKTWWTWVSPTYRGGDDYRIDLKKISFNDRNTFLIHS
jgi:hypothetical protein